MAAISAFVYNVALRPEEATQEMEAPDLTEAARLLDVRPPEEEFRSLVQARMETLAKLGHSAGSNAARLDLYAQALERGLTRIREARPR